MTSFLTKKDLERAYGLADTTVYRTLKACGLSTARRTYTPEEIETRFLRARQLFEAGLTSQQIQKYFSLKPTYAYQEGPRRTLRHQP